MSTWRVLPDCAVELAANREFGGVIPPGLLPVLLGEGIRFSPPGLARIDLEPLGSTRSGAVTILRFRVRKQPSV